MDSPAPDYALTTEAQQDSDVLAVACPRNLGDTPSRLPQMASVEAPPNRHELDRGLASARSSAQPLDRYLHHHINSVPYNEYCPPRATHLAHQVFGIPELLEMILSHLSIRQILQAQCLNRQFRDAVEGSTELQRKLCLLPSLSPYYQHPLNGELLHNKDDFPGLEFNPHGTCRPQYDGLVSADDEAERRTIIVQIRFTTTKLTLGSRCRRMLAFQPPLQEVRAAVRCCQDGFGVDFDEELIVRNSGGVTIGDLFDASKRLAGIHRFCPHADAASRDWKSGRVDPRPVSQARIVTDVMDPLHLTERQAREGVKALDAEEAERRAFVMARLRAYHAGNPLPEFTEWSQTYEPAETDQEED